MLLATTVLTQQAVTWTGARPLLAAGAATAAGGMFWLSRITEHSTFAGGMLGPDLLLGAGLGPLFVLIFLVGPTKVRDNDAGVASSMVNVGQQVGGAIGLGHHRHRADRHVLLPHPVRAGGVGVQPAEDRRRLPAVRPGSPGHDRGHAAGS